jgi:hypothetical protein
VQVRLSNMARVYGADGVTDATAIELRVRQAQAERQAAHDDRNLSRKLTSSERKAKRLRKLFNDTAADIHVQVCSPAARWPAPSLHHCHSLRLHDAAATACSLSPARFSWQMACV